MRASTNVTEVVRLLLTSTTCTRSVGSIEKPAVVIGSTFGVFSAGLFWTIGVRQHARPAGQHGCD